MPKSGIKVNLDVPGTGPEIRKGDRVRLRCDIQLRRGEYVVRDQEIVLTIGDRSFVAGFRYGLDGMRAGGRRVFKASPHLCYRDAELEAIPKNAELVIEIRDIELLEASSAARAPSLFSSEEPAFMPQITPFLMFDGQAAAAMDFYLSVFPNSAVVSQTRYGENEAGRAGTVQHAVFSLSGRLFQCIDSSVKHSFTFTPAVSLHVTCGSEAEVDATFAKLADGGQVLMPLGEYPFSRRYGWVNDKFGVSWQLSLAASPA